MTSRREYGSERTFPAAFLPSNDEALAAYIKSGGLLGIVTYLNGIAQHPERRVPACGNVVFNEFGR